MDSKHDNHAPRKSLETAAGLNRRESTHSHSNMEGDENQYGGGGVQSTKNNKNQLNSSSSTSSANVSKQKPKLPNPSGLVQQNSAAPTVPVFLTSQQQSTGNNNNSNNNNNNNSSGNLHSGTTHYTGMYMDQFPKVGEAYVQLNNLVEVLEEKVEGVIERHEAEFLVAYKNQMQKIRKELQEMKNNMDEQEKKLKAGDQLDELEKQLAWFRDESLKLYSKLASKDKQIADYKQIVLDQKKDLTYSENQIASLKKKIRALAKKASVGFGFADSEQNSQLNSFSQLHTASINNNNNNNRSSSIRNQNTTHLIDDRSLYMPPVTAQTFNKHHQTSVLPNRRPVSVDHMNNKNAATGQHPVNPWNFNQSGQSFHVSNNNNQQQQLQQHQFLLNDVVEQNETQGSQIGIEESQQQGINSTAAGQQQVINSNWGFNGITGVSSTNAGGVILQKEQFEGWMPQSEFIAEMIAKYSESDPIRLVKEITQMFRVEEEKRSKQTRVLKERLDKVTKEKLTQNVVRSDLENFFLECIETVRKQIIKRKPGGLMRSKNDTQLNFYLNQIKDYSVFRTEDKIKIIELLLSNERIIMFLYQKIFPQNFAKFVNSALESGGSSTLPITSSRAYPKPDDLTAEQSSYNIDHEAATKTHLQSQQVKDKKSSNPINDETDELARLIENIGFPDYQTAQQQQQQQQQDDQQQQHYGVSEYHAKTTAGVNSRQQRVTRPSTSQNPGIRQYGSGQNNLSVDGQGGGGGQQLNAQTTRQFGSDKFEMQKPNLTKQKIASLINSDFSSFPHRNSFKASKAAYKAY